MCWQLICVFFSFEWMLTCRLIVKMSFEIAIPSHNNPCMIHVWIKTNHSNCVWYKIGNLNPKKFNMITWYSNHNTDWNLKSTMIFKYFLKMFLQAKCLQYSASFIFWGKQDYMKWLHCWAIFTPTRQIFSKSNVTLMFVLENMHTLSITQVWHLHTWTM